MDFERVSCELCFSSPPAFIHCAHAWGYFANVIKPASKQHIWEATSIASGSSPLKRLLQSQCQGWKESLKVDNLQKLLSANALHLHPERYGSSGGCGLGCGCAAQLAIQVSKPLEVVQDVAQNLAHKSESGNRRRAWCFGFRSHRNFRSLAVSNACYKVSSLT